jgi:phage FluMu protein Com
MSFDYFVAELKCPNCNTVSSATGETCMQTKICKYSDYKYLGLGSKLDLEDNIEDCGYDCYKIPKDKKNLPY